MNNKIYNKGVAHLMLALMAAGLGMTACSSDESIDNGGKAENAVKVNISTRSDDATSPWTANDAVTILCNENGSENELQSATYTWSGSAWNATGHLYWPNGGKNLDFMGYYPTSATSNGLEFTIPTDQSDAAKLHAADYMTTDRMYNVSNSSTSHAVDFAFSHRLVKIVINNLLGTDVTITEPYIISKGSGVKTTVNNAEGTTNVSVAPTGEMTAIKPLVSTSSEGVITYTAYVAPCTLKSGTNTMFTYMSGGSQKFASFKGQISALVSGKTYTFDMINDEKVEILFTGVSDDFSWGDAEDEQDIN